MPAAVGPRAAQPAAPEPGATEAGATEPAAPAPGAAEPPAAMPAAAGPRAAQQAAPEPGATETGATEAGGTQRGAAEPGATEPAAAEPAAAEPPAAMPAAAGPRAAQQAAPEPGASEVGATEPAAVEPGATEARPAGRPQAPDGSGPTGTRPPAPSGRGRRTGPPKAQKKGPGGGLLMGRPFGVPVYVAPSWFLVAALITWVFGGQLDRVLPELGGARYLVSLFFAVAFYASVLVHELAHTVAALRFKLPVRRIQLQFFGGVSEIEKESETPGREFVLAFVGPLLSLVLAGVFYAGMRAVEPGTVPGVLLAGLMISNLIVAVFNLLPGLPLDGGRMLRAVVWKITGKPMSGTIAAAWVGRALAVSVLIGLPLLNQSGALGGDPQEIGGMNTVTDALLAAILAAIIWTGAGNSLRMARLREHLPELRARTLTRRAVPVESGTPLSEALRRANDAGARALVVVDPDGDPTAVVREAAIVSVPQHRRPWVTVSGLAQDLTEGMRVSAELAGEELLDTLRATPATEYLVVEDSGEIYGVLSAADVERAFVKAMARPS
ncbi:site-2 protease family protein [Streptomyces sp. A1499]|uniref:site-2 protease family protein n=1 Tax=Streptomyces sp. A1499 TaxID=2563104 RepID=UPI0019CF7012|nr:site-2 protease family protein [Streptomyces sp. A1499]